jgi:hypothetical protein
VSVIYVKLLSSESSAIVAREDAIFSCLVTLEPIPISSNSQPSELMHSCDIVFAVNVNSKYLSSRNKLLTYIAISGYVGTAAAGHTALISILATLPVPCLRQSI